MKLQSIRVKSSLPIVLLGIAIIVLIAGYTYLINLQKVALEAQSERFLNAISVVLNADRDLYQAKVAELNLVTNKQGDTEELQSHSENAQQVADRFNQYLSYLSVYPEITASFNNFDTAVFFCEPFQACIFRLPSCFMVFLFEAYQFYQVS